MNFKSRLHKAFSLIKSLALDALNLLINISKYNFKPMLILSLYLILVLLLQPNDSLHFFVLPVILVLWIYNKHFEKQNPDSMGFFHPQTGGFFSKNTGEDGDVPEAEERSYGQ